MAKRVCTKKLNNNLLDFDDFLKVSKHFGQTVSNIYKGGGKF